MKSATQEAQTDFQKKQTFKLDEFEGPLDLLLFLIKKNEINIYDIPVGQITEQFMDYLDYAVSTNLADLTEFYSMSAELLYIKSRMLLPVESDFDDEELEDPRQELVDKLIEYQKYKELSSLMEEKETDSEWTFERKKKQCVLPFEEEQLWEKVDTWGLMKTFSKLVAPYTHQQILSMYEEISVNEKITLMNELFEKQGECSFTDLIVREGSLLDIICAFMAILEAVKFKTACIYQNRMFGDIKIRPAVEAA
ncbi:MAG: segregation/condensation protein A [Treponema sp. CETP13]|nr:MAG: segregation/condensation protein A [Treponema sp. CETP13]